jgi:conjugal transfer pilus assembly protein TraW
MSVWVLVLLCYPGIVLSEDAALEDILNHTREIKENIGQDGVETIPDTQSPATMDADRAWLKGRNLAASESGEGEATTQQQRAWGQIMSATEQGAEAGKLGDGPPHPPVPENVMYVYISLAMPEETIRSLFHQALANKDLRSVVFVLRGWKPEGLNELVARLNKLFPEAQKLRDLPNVQIDPTLFEQQAIDVVPTFATKDAGGRWGTVVGSTSIEDAVRRIESNRYDGEVIGPTFDIEEPNILKVIQERIAKMDWKAEVERVKQNVLTKRTTGGHLPPASKDDSYLVDLTIVNNQDLQGTNGEVFAQAGTTVNPFDYMTTQKRFIFFDANDPEQLEQAVRWRQQHDYTTLITTLPLRTVEARKAAHERLRQPIYEINQMIVNRFRLTAVPAIAYQEGRMLRVDVVAVSSEQTAHAQGAL